MGGKAESQSKIGSATDLGTVIDRLTSILAADINLFNGLAAIFSVPLPVEDTGENTNPRKWEKEHGFTSARVAVVGPATTPLWAVGLAAVYPVAGRTAGQITTIYTLVIENPTGAAITAWLEGAGAAITPPYHVAQTDTLVVDFIAGMNVGNVDININASVATVVGQIIGTEETV